MALSQVPKAIRSALTVLVDFYANELIMTADNAAALELNKNLEVSVD